MTGGVFAGLARFVVRYRVPVAVIAIVTSVPSVVALLSAERFVSHPARSRRCSH
ncbi:MAG TPA: hypothetical protein VFW50_13335 [Streptosporangiaceae bacterium]|nr:hypothetical protein [Streptosporangiaceae bacterium]